MKDPADHKTLSLIPEIKKRGRPKTGKAKTAAQRKADQRDRDHERVLNTDVNDWTKKDCLVVLNSPLMVPNMKRAAIRQFQNLLDKEV